MKLIDTRRNMMYWNRLEVDTAIDEIYQNLNHLAECLEILRTELEAQKKKLPEVIHAQALEGILPENILIHKREPRKRRSRKQKTQGTGRPDPSTIII